MSCRKACVFVKKLVMWGFRSETASGVGGFEIYVQ